MANLLQPDRSQMKILHKQLFKEIAKQVETDQNVSEDDLRALMAVIGQMLITHDNTSTIRLQNVEGQPFAFVVSKEHYEDREAAQAVVAINHLESAKEEILGQSGF